MMKRKFFDGRAIFGASMSFGIFFNTNKQGACAYDAEKDFVPVAGYGTIPTALLVNPSVPVNSVSDLIALAKKKPGAVTFGTAGVGSALHIAGLELESLTGIKMTAVHYRGAAPALSV